MTTVNEKLLNKFIRHAVYIEKFKNGEALKMSRFIEKQVMPALNAKIATFMSRKRDVTRLKELGAALDKIMTAGMVKAGKQTIDTLKDLSTYEAQWVSDTLQKTIPLDVDLTMPSQETLHKLVTTKPFDGHKLSTWMTSYSNAAKTKMMKQISVGMALGESLPAIGQRIRGVMRIKRKQAEYIARTAVSSVVNNARDAVYKQNKDLIQKVQFVATLDMRTTLTCINLDGKVFPVDDGPRPPVHFNCRSICIPIVTAWNELGIEPPPPATRASMNGAVPEKMTYKDWFAKHTKNNPTAGTAILGPKRWAMYQKGTPLSGFVSKDYSPISLKTLATKEAVTVAKVAPIPKPKPTPPVPQSLREQRLAKPEVQSYIQRYQQAFSQNNRKVMDAMRGKLSVRGLWIDANGNLTTEIGQKAAGYPKLKTTPQATIKKTPVVPKTIEQQRAWEAGLTAKEREAISFWTKDVYAVGDIRSFQAGKLAELTPVKIETAKTFTEAVKRAPNYRGTIFRGQAFDKGVNNLKVGQTFSFDMPVSASKSLDVAEEFVTYAPTANANNVVMFEIRATSAKDISKVVLEEYADQLEVFVQSASKYKVLRKDFVKLPHIDAKGYWKIVLEEI